MQQLAQALEPRRRLNLAQHRPPQDLQRLLVLQTRPFRREALQRNHRHRLRDRRVQCLQRLRQVHQPHHLPRALLRLLRQPALLCLQAHRQRSYLRLPQRPPRQTGAVVVIMTPTTTEDQATVTETYDFRKPSVDDRAQRAQPSSPIRMRGDARRRRYGPAGGPVATSANRGSKPDAVEEPTSNPSGGSASGATRFDKVDRHGSITLRYRGRLHHIGIGAAYRDWRIAMLIDGRNVEIVALHGPPLRRLVLDRTRDYQPQA